MKIHLSLIFALFTLAALKEGSGGRRADQSGSLRVIEEIDNTGERQSCKCLTDGHYYRIETSTAVNDTHRSYFRLYEKGNPRKLVEKLVFSVNNIGRAEEKVRRSISRQRLAESTSESNWFFVEQSKEEAFLSAIKEAIEQEEADINGWLQFIIQAMTLKDAAAGDNVNTQLSSIEDKK